MYKSAVNLGSGGFGNVGYFADGGEVMTMDMGQTAPGATPTYLNYMPEEMQRDAEQEEQGLISATTLLVVRYLRKLV
jgi:hypothetical protein